MEERLGLRERKKLQQRHRLADVAAALFAEHGYDAVSMSDVARAADVSSQTVYNYFPAKEDLVLDRADEIRARYGRVVRERPAGTSPASVVRPLVREDVERFRDADPRMARGEFPALCVASAALRRFALEFRERQVRTVAEALLETDPALAPLAARAHVAALISVVQSVTDAIGAAVLADDDRQAVADALQRDADLALDGLDRHFTDLTAGPTP
jgi:AcrR family transcriptional regulator